MKRRGYFGKCQILLFCLLSFRNCGSEISSFGIWTHDTEGTVGWSCGKFLWIARLVCGIPSWTSKLLINPYLINELSDCSKLPQRDPNQKVLATRQHLAIKRIAKLVRSPARRFFRLSQEVPQSIVKCVLKSFFGICVEIICGNNV